MEKLSLQKLARIAGLLILLRFGLGVAGIFYQNISTDLQKIALNSSKLQISIIFDFISGLASVTTAIVLYGWVKKHNSFFSLWFLVFSAIGFTKTFFDVNSIDSLIYLSTLKTNENITVSTNQIIYLFDKLHFYGLLLHVLTVLPFYLCLFQSRAVPRFISVFALFAIILVFGNTIYQLSGTESSMLFYLPNGILQLLLGSWLIIKGLK